MAVPQYFADEAPQPGSTEATELAALSAAVEARADSWVDRVKCAPPFFFVPLDSTKPPSFPARWLNSEGIPGGFCGVLGFE